MSPDHSVGSRLLLSGLRLREADYGPSAGDYHPPDGENLLGRDRGEQAMAEPGRPADGGAERSRPRLQRGAAATRHDGRVPRLPGRTRDELRGDHRGRRVKGQDE